MFFSLIEKIRILKIFELILVICKIFFHSENVYNMLQLNYSIYVLCKIKSNSCSIRYCIFNVAFQNL